MAGFNDYNNASQMAQLIRQVAEQTIDRLRPRPRYGVVTGMSSSYCMVQMTGDEQPVSVSFSAGIRPSIIGQTVRVGGTGADKYIDDVITGQARVGLVNVFDLNNSVATLTNERGGIRTELDGLRTDVNGLQSEPIYDIIVPSAANGWGKATGRSLPKAFQRRDNLVEWVGGRIARSSAVTAAGGQPLFVGTIGTRGRPVAGSSFITVIVSNVNRTDPCFIETGGNVHWRPPTSTTLAAGDYLAFVGATYPITEA